MDLSWSETRVGRGVLFVAITWTIAGAFLLLQLGLPELLSLAVSRGWVGAKWLMPAAVTNSAGCGRNDSESVASLGAEGPAAGGEARYATWTLGQRLGFVAAVAGDGLPEERQRSLQGDIDAAARALAVGPPRPPPILRLANALHEFSVYLEADPDCVAAVLAARYGPSYGHLYKFGAAIGYSLPYQANGVRGVFAPQIEVYGQGAGIPRDLWLPMTLELPIGIPGANDKQKITIALARLDAFIRAGR